MAETTANRTVLDTITQFFTKNGECRQDVAKYLAAVHIKPCDDENACWTTIACKQTVELPEIDREMIVVNQTLACNLFDQSDSWQEYVPDSTRMMAEYTPELYYTPERFKEMYELQGSTIPHIVLIDIADEARTQFAFRAYLKTLGATFPANEDTEVAMIPTTWQPTGEPFCTSGVVINVCQ